MSTGDAAHGGGRFLEVQHRFAYIAPRWQCAPLDPSAGKEKQTEPKHAKGQHCVTQEGARTWPRTWVTSQLISRESDLHIFSILYLLFFLMHGYERALNVTYV